MRDKCDTLDLAASRVAARQHGIISLAQLIDLGFEKNGIARRVRRGQFHRIHRGVYAVGHRGLSLEAEWMAAVLACGSGAALSHVSAAAHWGLLRSMPGPVHVSAPTYAGRRQRDGIRLHRCASLGASRIGAGRYAGAGLDAVDWSPLLTVRHEIPVTTPARTVADLEGSVEARLARRARRQAELAGYSLDVGAGARPAPGPRTRSARTRSDFEDEFLDLCLAHGLPRPEVNVRVGRWTVDFLWPARRLAVETDSYAFHRGSVAFEDDHARDLDLRARGYAVHRFTEQQIDEQPLRVIADLRRALEPR